MRELIISRILYIESVLPTSHNITDEQLAKASDGELIEIYEGVSSLLTLHEFLQNAYEGMSSLLTLHQLSQSADELKDQRS